MEADVRIIRAGAFDFLAAHHRDFYAWYVAPPGGHDPGFFRVASNFVLLLGSFYPHSHTPSERAVIELSKAAAEYSNLKRKLCRQKTVVTHNVNGVPCLKLDIIRRNLQNSRNRRGTHYLAVISENCPFSAFDRGDKSSFQYYCFSFPWFPVSAAEPSFHFLYRSSFNPLSYLII